MAEVDREGVVEVAAVSRVVVGVECRDGCAVLLMPETGRMCWARYMI